MDLTPHGQELLEAYLPCFTSLAGDRRTATLLGETIRSILASESLLCCRIVAFSPSAGAVSVE
jgi:hypothetical protein